MIEKPIPGERVASFGLLVMVALCGLLASSTVGGAFGGAGAATTTTETILADDFEDSFDGALYRWSAIEPAPSMPWWQRQWPIEDCPTYAARYLEQNLWDACPYCTYWQRTCGTNSGHRCNLRNGDEFVWVIFFHDFELVGLSCWDEVVQ